MNARTKVRSGEVLEPAGTASSANLSSARLFDVVACDNETVSHALDTENDAATKRTSGKTTTGPAAFLTASSKLSALVPL